MRYFFNLQDGTCLRDEDGEELADDSAAIAVARKIAENLARNNPLAKEWSIVACDVSGRIVATIPC
jgi:hypothetical protein